MHEIKFRAYDEDAEHMFYSDKPEDDYFFSFGDEDGDGELRGFVLRPPRGSNDPMEPPEPYCDDYPVEQYTGLHDKNGKEIYESDICSFKFDAKDPSHPGWYICGSSGHHPENARVVRFENGCFELDYKLLYKELQFNPDYEIIGNIHENPELEVKE